MTLEEIVRHNTLALRDALGLLDSRYRDRLGEREAAEERLRRASNEISAQHIGEQEAKHARHANELLVSEVRSKLDDIERQRSELIERLMELQRRQEGAEHALKEAKAAAERAEASMREARGTVERMGAELEKTVGERTQHQRRLRHAYAASLDEYLRNVAQRLEQFVIGEQDRQRRQAARDAFRRARHEDAEIGNRCDQRDQLRELIKLATVPAVSDKLEHLLADVETELDRLFPGALSIDEGTSGSTFVEELYYFTNKDGRACLLVPVGESTWNAVNDGVTDTSATAAVRMIWNVVAGLGLTPPDGQFRLEKGRCVFSSGFGPERISALVALSVSPQGTKDIQFRLAPLPSEIQEALPDEA